jgi:hypothetical protein
MLVKLSSCAAVIAFGLIGPAAQNSRLGPSFQSLSPSGQGLGMSEPQRACVPSLGLHQANGQKVLSDRDMIPDGLLGSLDYAVSLDGLPPCVRR